LFTAKVKVKVDIPRLPTVEEKKAAPTVESYPDIKEVELTLKSDNRNLMRNLKMLCIENKIPCETVVEQAPREVKFKSVE